MLRVKCNASGIFKIFTHNKYSMTDSPHIEIHRNAGSKAPASCDGGMPNALSNGSNAAYVEDIYNSWLRDPSSVHVSWASFFKNNGYVSPNESGEGGKNSAKMKEIEEHLAVQNIIRSYQTRGHLVADLDPLGITTTKPIINSDGVARRANEDVLRQHSGFFFGKNDMTTTFKLPSTTFIGGKKKMMPLGDILDALEKVYCNTMGIEFMSIPSMEKCNWIRERFETPGITEIPINEKKLVLERLIRATGFEEFLAKKYPSEKRFGIEGAEMMIPAVKTIIDVSSTKGVESVIIGMAHRGRLNTLANICRKPLEDVFSQFFGLYSTDQGSGDVKYHLGTFIERVNRATNKNIRLAIVANASHLESQNAIVLGKTHAEQFYKGDLSGDKVMPILMHGDASFCGQGAVYESLHLASLPHYTTHGTIHIVVNNQVGFTTDPRFSRSSPYCTDVALVLKAPIFHVNADHPEAVVYTCKVAAEWRAAFHEDVVIDLVSYRRNGHNEADEPMFTQPLMYQIIKKHPKVLSLYGKKLIDQKIIKPEELDKLLKSYESICDKGWADAKAKTSIQYKDWIDSPWSGFFEGRDPNKVTPTGIKEETIRHIGMKVSSAPPNAADFVLHNGILRLLEQRRKLLEEGVADWALGECFAFGSLLKEGVHVRLSGEDVERGTFSHRHHVYHHQKVDKATYVPLRHLYPDQAHYSVSNSSLSEYAIMGFEHGYSMASPNQLVIWEGQFGDFCNTGQCIIDQYLSSGQAKWVRQSGLVLLLPHGMEGQGPEHSSARLERFLQGSADDPDCAPPDSCDFALDQLRDINWIITNLTTPANLFHVLRRQVALPFRKPLVNMSPKSLLRHPLARSKLCEFLEGSEFKRIIPDDGTCKKNAGNVEKIVFCSGKVYYELFTERADREQENKIAIVRVEQICPFPYDLIKKELECFKKAEVVWAQEEHKNQGAWGYVQPRFETAISLCEDSSRSVSYAGRAPAAATATGNKQQFIKEVEGIKTDIFGELSAEEKECIKKKKEANIPKTDNKAIIPSSKPKTDDKSNPKKS